MKRKHNSGEIYAFDELLRELEFAGKLAHPMCVLDAQAARKRLTIKRGLQCQMN